MAQALRGAVYCPCTLEPRAGVTNWEDGRLTAWTGTQRPFGVQEELAKEFDIPTQHIRVIMPDTGSGYGGKHTGEAAIEAAKLSRAVGKPVKVLGHAKRNLNRLISGRQVLVKPRLCVLPPSYETLSAMRQVPSFILYYLFPMG